MTAKDCIKGRRSIRKFKKDPIDPAVLSDLVETASYAPSWKHTQIARYIAVSGALKDQLRVRGISRITDHCAKAGYSFPQRGGKLYILYLIHITVIFCFVKQPAVNGNRIFFNIVRCKGKGQSQKHPSFLLSEFCCHSHPPSCHRQNISFFVVY